MKLVREYITERFSEESDPIHDLGIGLKTIQKRWLDKYIGKNTAFFERHGFTENQYTFNIDGTIDVYGSVDLRNQHLGNFPYYIKFGVIDGEFNIMGNDMTSLKGCPREIYGYFSFQDNKISSLKYFPEIVHPPRKKMPGHVSLSGVIYCAQNPGEFTRDDILDVCDCISDIHTRPKGY